MTRAFRLTWLATVSTLWVAPAGAQLHGSSRFHHGMHVSPSQGPPAQPPTGNRPPTVQARCEPCTVKAGKKSAVSADATDPDGDALTYRWSALAGTFQNPVDRQTVWTSPQQQDSVVATVTVNDGRGGTASASITLHVLSPLSVLDLNYEDDDVDLDRSKLKAEALGLADNAIATRPGLAGASSARGIPATAARLSPISPWIERRGAAVRDSLSLHEVASSTEACNHAEERPKAEHALDEARRLNRRVALVVKIQ
jgi:hypothetical protein